MERFESDVVFGPYWGEKIDVANVTPNMDQGYMWDVRGLLLSLKLSVHAKFIIPLYLPFHDFSHNHKPLILDISLMMKAILRHVMISRSVSENQNTPKPVVH